MDELRTMGRYTEDCVELFKSHGGIWSFCQGHSFLFPVPLEFPFWSAIEHVEGDCPPKVVHIWWKRCLFASGCAALLTTRKVADAVAEGVFRNFQLVVSSGKKVSGNFSSSGTRSAITRIRRAGSTMSAQRSWFSPLFTS